ncbi:MAG: flagellar M-ring protein FliF [Clostridiales bacterium]|jgi:flagellar basal-body M-ring protein/flagellar hook-basal body protein fliF|nr:flagellar M-ring protein FliF [Clostridiales bacterium]
MKIDVKSLVQKVKTFWQNQPPKRKRIVLIAGGGVLAFALIATIILNVSNAGTKVLFPGMTQSEAAQVYAELQEMGVKAEINSGGEVRVPQSEWDKVVFQLNQKGYPKTTLSYDTFSSSTGFTSTEFEKKTALIFQAQDRMQQTLMRQEGIADATVTFTVPETSSYVWDQSSEKQSSAGVSVLMKAGYELTPERVSAIKHLAATSVPNLKAENVVVVDAATGVEVSDGSQGSSSAYSTQRLDFEREIAKSIEDNIKRLLSSRYGADGVTAVATVTLDYDKMVTESKQYQPRSDGESAGVINHYEENYSLDGNVSASGIAGEQNNTDAPPEYQNQDGSSAPTTDYQRSVDYDVGYVLTQIEKGEPILKKASVAVIVNDPNFDTQVEETLVDLISKSVNITADNIKVTNLNISSGQNNNNNNDNWLSNLGGMSLQQLLIIGIVALLLIIFLIILFTTLLRRRKRRKEHEQETRFEEEEQERQQALQREIEEHKRQLQSEAMASSDEKENAITQEVREFVKDNPEITAALIRSMLREEK